MLLPSITLKEHKTKGLGLFATTFIPQGTVVWAPCKTCAYYPADKLGQLAKEELQTLNELGYTTYDKGILLPCGNACYMNHSCDPNVLDYGLDFGIAIKDIHCEEEICCDYHAWEIEDWEMICKCNTKNCSGKISPKFCDDKLKRNWSKQVEFALTKVRETRQLLHNQLLESSQVYEKHLKGLFNYLADESISVKTILGKN